MISVQIEVSCNGDSIDTLISIQKGTDRNVVECVELIYLIEKLIDEMRQDVSALSEAAANSVRRTAPHPTQKG